MCLGCRAAGFGEQRTNGSFCLPIVTLTDLRVANLAGSVDEVPVSVRVPGDEVVVQPDRILEPVLMHGTLNVLNRALECELGTVDADHRAGRLILIVHPTQESEGVLAVHTREGLELEQDDAVAKGRKPQRLAVPRVEPRIDAEQFGRAPEDSQWTRSVLLQRPARRVSRTEGHDLIHGGGRMTSQRSLRAIAKSHVAIALAK